MKETLDEHVRRFGEALEPFGAKLEALLPGKARRARADADADVELDLVTLEDGSVDFAPPQEAISEDDAGSRTSVRLTDLPGNTIHEALGALDRKLTPHQGLRRLTVDGTLAPFVERVSGRTLLVIHGTFSNSDNVLGGIAEGDPEFLRWARKHYDQVLTFDYASLSNRTVASAMTLQRMIMERVDGSIDLVCHSQGGLVARYWLERFEPARLSHSRVLLVGAPLAGTSLAAPASLRRSLRLLATAGAVLGVGAGVVSGATLLGAVGGLFGVVQKTVGLASFGVLLDAAVALVPGVDSMSRVSTNTELIELRRATRGVPPGYFAITGDFDVPRDRGKPWQRAGSRTLDEIREDVFGVDNDLIVDTDSHTELSDAHVIGRDDPGRIHRYTRNTEVHHRNYFSQADALEFIARRLEPGRSR